MYPLWDVSRVSKADPLRSFDQKAKQKPPRWSLRFPCSHRRSMLGLRWSKRLYQNSPFVKKNTQNHQIPVAWFWNICKSSLNSAFQNQSTYLGQQLGFKKHRVVGVGCCWHVELQILKDDEQKPKPCDSDDDDDDGGGGGGGWWMVDGGDDDGDDISEFFKSRDIDTDACPMPGLEGAWFRPDWGAPLGDDRPIEFFSVQEWHCRSRFMFSSGEFQRLWATMLSFQCEFCSLFHLAEYFTDPAMLSLFRTSDIRRWNWPENDQETHGWTWFNWEVPDFGGSKLLETRQVRRIDTAKDIAENLAKSPNVMCAVPGYGENLRKIWEIAERWWEDGQKMRES